MRVVVLFEESQRVCTAFRDRGHEAYSCDIQECSGGHPEWHIHGDAIPLLYQHWDLIIAHPPCTYLTSASAVRLYDTNHNIIDKDRLAKGMEAAELFRKVLDADCDRIAVENPTPLKIFGLPPYTQIIEPFMFGDPWRKRTCLWLKGLPKLQPTNIVEPTGLWVGSTSKRRDPTIDQRYTLRSKRDQREREQRLFRASQKQWLSNGGKEGNHAERTRDHEHTR